MDSVPSVSGMTFVCVVLTWTALVGLHTPENGVQIRLLPLLWPLCTLPLHRRPQSTCERAPQGTRLDEAGQGSEDKRTV